MIIKEIMDKINGQDVTKIQQSLLIPQKSDIAAIDHSTKYQRSIIQRRKNCYCCAWKPVYGDRKIIIALNRLRRI